MVTPKKRLLVNDPFHRKFCWDLLIYDSDGNRTLEDVATERKYAERLLRLFRREQVGSSPGCAGRPFCGSGVSGIETGGAKKLGQRFSHLLLPTLLTLPAHPQNRQSAENRPVFSVLPPDSPVPTALSRRLQPAFFTFPSLFRFPCHFCPCGMRNALVALPFELPGSRSFVLKGSSERHF